MQEGRISAKWFCLMVIPFFLNDIGGIFITNGIGWLANDYISRLIPLAIAWHLVRRSGQGWAMFGLGRMRVSHFVASAVMLSVVGIALDQCGLAFWEKTLPDTAMGGYPVEGVFLEWFDLTMGLLLVAFSEEVVFRSAAAQFFDKLGMIPFYLVTALLFGAAHWSGGIALVVSASFIGATFMYFYRATDSGGRLWPIVFAHFAVNFVDFSGLWPL